VSNRGVEEEEIIIIQNLTKDTLTWKKKISFITRKLKNRET
jgi:hypothetical protein